MKVIIYSHEQLYLIAIQGISQTEWVLLTQVGHQAIEFLWGIVATLTTTIIALLPSQTKQHMSVLRRTRWMDDLLTHGALNGVDRHIYTNTLFCWFSHAHSHSPDR